MKSKLRTPKELNKDEKYLLKEKRIIAIIMKIAFTIVIITVLINLIVYLSKILVIITI